MEIRLYPKKYEKASFPSLTWQNTIDRSIDRPSVAWPTRRHSTPFYVKILIISCFDCPGDGGTALQNGGLLRQSRSPVYILCTTVLYNTAQGISSVEIEPRPRIPRVESPLLPQQCLMETHSIELCRLQRGQA